MELCQFPPSKDLVQLVLTSSLSRPGLQSLLLTALTATVLEVLKGAVVLEVARAVDFHRNMALEGENRLSHKRVAFSECTEAAAGSLQGCQSDL